MSAPLVVYTKPFKWKRSVPDARYQSLYLYATSDREGHIYTLRQINRGQCLRVYDYEWELRCDGRVVVTGESSSFRRTKILAEHHSRDLWLAARAEQALRESERR